ncbi:MAG: coproporphyrinogen dehydrogenase HemZ [Oscillospiraceae bacterium]|nr:coproporphyrinogen dehydrogenase HemZ [Oscillospiraceae bacterium]
MQNKKYLRRQNSDFALIFRGHNFSYEVQAVAKVFIPGIRFRLCEDGSIPEDCKDYILTEIRNSENPENSKILNLTIFYHNQELRHSREVPENSERDVLEYELCVLLYSGLQELTGYQPPWGMLTGIRPVRKVLQELEKGLTPEQACVNLQAKYFISDEKIRIALATALVQQPILPHDAKQIGFYIAIPFCPTRCSYCSFVSHSISTENARKLIPAYVRKLCEEIRMFGKIIRKFDLSVQSVYIGGGTPTAISAQQLGEIMQAVQDSVDLQNVREYTVEAGRADTITKEKLQVIYDMGASRISINPQTMQDAVLQAVGRCHTAQQVTDAFLLARETGFTDINMDLIAGLPADDCAGFADTLRKVLALSPDSITVHALTLKRSADLYHAGDVKNSEKFKIPEIPEIEQMLRLSAKMLPENSYRPYYLYRQKNTIGNLENIGYAKPCKENLYNILIMDETQTILGAGCGASNKIIQRDGDITRIMNYKFPYEYIHDFEKLMQKKAGIIRELEKL